MTHLRVWAPRAQRVSVVVLLEGLTRSHALRRQDDWWVLEAKALPEGADYAFSLDGGPPLPDPRAARLPYGVHGPGRVVDHARFAWTDEGWKPPPLASGVVYELHIGSFSPEGSFDGAGARLDALVDLGITHVELMPVHSFSGRHGWGYDGVGLFAPHEPYGGPDGLKRLVDSAHARGLAVLLDVVYNHLGPDGNQLSRFGPYFTEQQRTPWGEAPNLDGPGSHEVRRFFCDNALQWLRDYHLDGLRIDAVHALCDRSATHLLAQLREEVDALAAATGRELLLIAESDRNDPRIVMPSEQGGYGMDAQWNDDFHHALHAVLSGERTDYYADFGLIADLAESCQSPWAEDGFASQYDPRAPRRLPLASSGQRLVAYLQNHDQVGNRPHGERSSQLLGSRELRVAAGLVLLSPFIPLLFQGEEWGASSPFLYFTSYADSELARGVGEGRRRELTARGWDCTDMPDPQDPASLERSRLDWSEREREPHAGLLEWHRRLIQIRRAWPELCDGRLENVRLHWQEGERWLCIERGPLRILCNLDAAPRTFSLPAAPRPALLLTTDAAVRLAAGAVSLPPVSLALVHDDPERARPNPHRRGGPR